MRPGNRKFRIINGTGAKPPAPGRGFGFGRPAGALPRKRADGRGGMIGGWMFLLLLSIGAYFAAKLPPPEQTVTGELQGAASASDGDSLRLDGRRVRLEGIDAPEIGQTCRRGDVTWDCGAEARQRLRALTSGLATVCRLHGRDRYGRDLGVCEAGQRDLGREMVLSGYAVSYGRYQHEEEVAREGRVGLWAGDFVRPQAWRRSHGGAEETPHEASDRLELAFQWLEEQARAIFRRIVDGG
ncbi:thermonuclease family protein [Sinorhizobium sp. 8-89]|uniref:thermonuclease family protein n=1 Tax=Sinorhizobium sp. 7-81 TaxID=3049087 RepID=UPI0024C3BCC4|nr:thermonuclease family protein [Sinorhizobium sp. 7-81]